MSSLGSWVLIVEALANAMWTWPISGGVFVVGSLLMMRIAAALYSVYQ